MVLLQKGLVSGSHEKYQHMRQKQVGDAICSPANPALLTGKSAEVSALRWASMARPNLEVTMFCFMDDRFAKVAAVQDRVLRPALVPFLYRLMSFMSVA